MYELIPGKLTLNNPVMAASGTLGYGDEFAKRGDVSEIGAIVCKGITLRPRAGNPPTRIIETAGGALNSIGLANIGMEAVIRDRAPLWAHLPCPIIVNINGETIDEYADLASGFDGVCGVAAIEINVSCPNVKNGGMAFGVDPRLAAQVTQAVRAATSFPLLVKLTPNAGDLVAIARAVVEAGADALVVANTYVGFAVDLGTGKPRLSNAIGGLSGAAIKPLTLRLVYDIASSILDIPIIGCGGAMNGADVVEYLMAGASAVQIGTASLVDPFAVPRSAAELRRWLTLHHIEEPNRIVGCALNGSRLRNKD